LTAGNQIHGLRLKDYKFYGFLLIYVRI